MTKSGNYIHGLNNHPVQCIWDNIKQRCYSVSNRDYHNYGGRGITLCDEWKDDLGAFYDYISKLPNYGKPGYTLDREDNDKGYYPGNVRWADRQTQIINQRMRSSNTSGYIGIYHMANGNWASKVMVNYISIHIGVYHTKEEAVEARNNYIKENNLAHKIQKIL